MQPELNPDLLAWVFVEGAKWTLGDCGATGCGSGTRNGAAGRLLSGVQYMEGGFQATWSPFLSILWFLKTGDLLSIHRNTSRAVISALLPLYSCLLGIHIPLQVTAGSFMKAKIYIRFPPVCAYAGSCSCGFVPVLHELLNILNFTRSFT